FMTAKPTLAQTAAPATAAPAANPTAEDPKDVAPATAAPAEKPVEVTQKEVTDEEVAVSKTDTVSKDELVENNGKDTGKFADSAGPAPKMPKDPTAQRDQEFRKQMGELDRANRDQQRLQRDLARAQQQVQQLSKRLAEASERLAKLQMQAAGIPAGEDTPHAGAGLWMRGAGGAMAMTPPPAPKAENILPPTVTAPEQAPVAEDRARAAEDRRQAADDRRMDRIERQMEQLARSLDQLRRDMHKDSDTSPESGAKK
ncbi:MAG TPA: hypothetical protein VFW23_10095, partial [Tepidisphaeraceae bacterium]|nr:hypothetical protein [Tepidisphaeraceae bacterium]